MTRGGNGRYAARLHAEKVMRGSKADPGRRDDMEKAAAPYVHPKLASIQHSKRWAHG